MDAYGQAGAIPDPRLDVGSEQCPLCPVTTGTFYRQQALEVVGGQTLWTAISHLKGIFYHREPCDVLAMSVFAHVKTIAEPSSALVSDFLFRL